MQKAVCAYEASVAAALHTGSWDEALLKHLSACSHCGESVQIAECMRSLNADPKWPPMCDPDVLWIKFQLLDEQATRERAMRTFLVLETFSAGLISTCAALLAINWPKMQAILFDMLTQTRGTESLGQSMTNLFSITLVSVGITLAVVAVTWAIQPLLSGE